MLLVMMKGNEIGLYPLEPRINVLLLGFLNPAFSVSLSS